MLPKTFIAQSANIYTRDKTI